jgi:hypothetical protein
MLDNTKKPRSSTRELAKYDRKKSNQEAGERRAARARNDPYDKI